MDHTPEFIQSQLPLEEWRDIPGYEGRYQVSNLGNVRSMGRRQDCTRFGVPYTRVRPGKQLSLCGEPYLRFVGYKRGRKTMLSVHQVAALAFLGPRPEGHQVNHINGVPSDNRICNLEYVTPKENIQHCIEVLGKSRKGNNSPLCEDDIREIRRLRETGMTLQVIGDIFGIHFSTAGKIARRRSWGWVE